MSYIKGKFVKTIFNNKQNGYYVGLLKVNECSKDLGDIKKSINFVGIFHKLIENTNYIMNGDMTIHARYGEQFNVTSYEVLKPEKKEEIVTFLSSDLFPIGESLALKIYEALGNNCIDKILENPNVLNKIPRLSLKKQEKIYNILKEYQGSSQIIMQLNELGFSFKESLSIYNKYKSDTKKIIDYNIYELIDSLDINFSTVDSVALKNGILEDDERRLKALAIFVIKKILFENGDIYVTYEEIKKNIEKYVGIESEYLEYILIKLNKQGKIIIEKNRYYLKEYYEDEEYIASRLTHLNELKSDKIDISKYLEKLQKDNDIKYDKVQKKAIEIAINNNLTIITGGPGTGKTTIVKAIVSILLNLKKVNEESIALLAPTGRASKRLAESTLLPAMTIHRFLKWDKENDTFLVNEYMPSNCKYIIVDEVSMIDNTLMASLLRGLKDDVKLVLVGDYYQLPSVREGQVLKDLIDSEVPNIVSLTALYRQNENSYIIELASEIKNQELSNFLEKKDDYNFIKSNNMNLKNTLENILDKAINKGYNELDIQILVPMYKGENGIINLNKVLQNKFNPRTNRTKELEVGEITYRVGDKVLQLVNDIDNSVFNGDIGYIVNILSSRQSNSKRNEIHVDFDGNVVIYTPSKFVEITHGYAISIHKAQGSEFDTVIIPMSNSYKYMLYNKLIYTAVTRAKKNLIILGDEYSFIYAVNNNYTVKRKTTLKEKLINMNKNNNIVQNN